MPIKGLSIERKLLEDGTVAQGYSFEGNPCMHLELTTKVAIQAAKYQLVYKELEFCEALLKAYPALFETVAVHQQINFVNENEEHLRLRAAYTAAIVTYAKVFTQGGPGRTVLHPSAIFKNDGSGYKDFHDWIISQRHSYVAHAGENDLEGTKTVLLIHPPFFPSNWRYVFTHAQFVPTFTADEAADFLIVVRYVMSWVYEKVKGFVRHVLKEHMQPVTEFHARARYATIQPARSDSPKINPELASPIPI